MANDQRPDESKKEHQFPCPVSEPVLQRIAVAIEAQAKAAEGKPQNGSEETKPLFVQEVGGDDLEPFEEQTLAIARRTFWIALFGFLAALAAAVFVGSQVKIMSYQTQIMGNQSESATAGAIESERNTRKQLGIAQQQAEAAQDSAEAIQDQVSTARKEFQLDQRPFVDILCCTSMDATLGTPGEPTIGKPLYLNVSYTNVGKTPAIGAIPRFHVLSGYGANDIHADPPDVFPRGYGVTIPPYRERPQVTPIISVKDTFTITEIGDIKPFNVIPWDGVTPIIVFGRITYSDNFGKRYCAPLLSHWLRGAGWANTASIDVDHPKHTLKLSDFCPPGTSL